MFKFKGTSEQLHEERQKNAALRAKLDKAGADLEYIAMMTDVELDDGKIDETEGYDNSDE